MNNNKIVILCPEIVPMDNKGEEAIIRGIMDLLGLDEENCEYHIVDPAVKTMTIRNGLYLHPPKLFFQEWRTKEFGLDFTFERIYSSACSILRHLLDRFFPRWVNYQPKAVSNYIRYIKNYRNNNDKAIPNVFKGSIKHLSKVDYIIAGHNGGLDVNVCHFLLGVHSELNSRYTIFGSCMSPEIVEKNKLNLYRSTFTSADNVIARNPLGYRWAEKNFKDLKPVLAPDPAFGLNPINRNTTIELLEHLGLTKFFKKDVLLVTNAEPAPISRYAFDDENSRLSKISAHRRFFGRLLDKLLSHYDFNILFLPHTIGPTIDMDDRVISKDIIKNSHYKNDINGRCYVLEEDLSASELKGIISSGKMLLAERVHSVIGAIGVITPIMCLASNKDKRVEGMLKEMANLSDNIYYLNNPSIDSFMKQFERIYNNLDNEKQNLEKLNHIIKSQLNTYARVIKSQIDELYL